MMVEILVFVNFPSATRTKPDVLAEAVSPIVSLAAVRICSVIALQPSKAGLFWHQPLDVVRYSLLKFCHIGGVDRG